jgi:hypothetical protein
MRVRLTCLLSLLVIGGAGQAWANWAPPAPEPLNFDARYEGEQTSIANVGGVPYVVWDETNGTKYQLRVKRLDPDGWAPVGGSLNVDTGQNAFYEDIADVNGVPYVVSGEDAGTGKYQVHVKRLENGSWTSVGGVLNIDVTADARYPTIANVGGVPYVAWSEKDGLGRYQVHVRRFDGATWSDVGGSLNVSSTQSAGSPALGVVAGVPYIAWSESSATVAQLWVKRLEGNAWVPVGSGSLNMSATHGTGAAALADVGGVPYVAWTETDGGPGQLYVKRFDGSAWQPVGAGSLNVDTAHFVSAPSIAGVGSTPVVTWSEDFGSGYHDWVKRFDGASWAFLGSNPLNVDPAFTARDPDVADIGGVPYLSWDEYVSDTVAAIHVRRLEPDIGAESATPTATGATLTAQVDDFGLALPIGFEFGTTAAFGTQTPLQSTTGAGASTVTQDIAGLAPQTGYSFRAFGSDGVRQTALGATQTFTTLAAGGGPPPPPGVPVITNLKLTPATFLTAKGTVVTYDDSVAATTTLTVQRPAIGRRKGGACVKATRRPPKSKRCTRYVRVGSFTHPDTAGHNSFRFKGRVGGRKLKPGAYRLRAVPRNAAGAGKAATRRFRVKRR